jgi:glyoxylase-like metal-dependent hydrolase (beta-lactamase superfamily II)
MQPVHLTAIMTLSLSFVSSQSLADPFAWTFQQLAPDVWAGLRDDPVRIPFMPNTTFVISADGVVVFDGGGLPLMAERAISKIRTLTDRPVTHVIVSHWHQDHNLGISAYLQEFPNVQVISHPYTRQGIRRNMQAHEQEAHQFVTSNFPALKQFVATGEYAPGRPLGKGEKEWYQQAIADEAIIDREYRRFTPTYPNLTFENRLTIYSGDRQIELLHLGAGNTAGDIIMWLPDEKIVATGDLVVMPVPYGHGGHAAEWAGALRQIKALGYSSLVPGHGAVQHDSEYLDLLTATLQSVDAQTRQAVESSLSLEETSQQVDLSAFAARFTGADEFLRLRFEEWFTGPIVAASYRLLSGQDADILPAQQ